MDIRIKKTLTNPLLKDIWLSTRIIRITRGLGLGIFQYTYHVFLYDHFGADVKALKSIVFLMVLTSILILLTQVPTGALADHIGRKKVIILSFVFGTIACFLRTWVYFVSSFTFSFSLAFLAVVFYSLSFTLFDGSFTAWLIDTVKERNIKEGYGSILARSYGSMMLAKIFGGIISLSLYLTGYVYYAFGIGCVGTLLCTVYCGVTMKETHSMEFHKGPYFMQESFMKMKKIIISGFKISTKTLPIAYMIFMYAGFMTLITVVNYLWPVAMKANFGANKMSPYWFVVVFTSMVMAFLGAKILEKLTHHSVNSEKCELPATTLWSWFASICLIMSMSIMALGINSMQGHMNLLFFIVALAFFNVGYGFLMPAFDILINDYIPKNNAKERATVMSFASMLLELFLIIFMFPSSGASGETTTVGWVLPASILFILTIVMWFLMRRYNTKNNVLEPSAVLVEN